MTMHRPDVSIRLDMSASGPVRGPLLPSDSGTIDVTVTEWATGPSMSTPPAGVTTLVLADYVDFDAIDSVHEASAPRSLEAVR